MSEVQTQRDNAIEAVREIWRSGEKLLKGFKLYGAGHANAAAFSGDLHQKLAAFLSAHGALEVVLTTQTVFFEGEKLLRGAGGADKNFAHALGLAGVTKLRFEPGFDRDELDRLFTVLVKNAGNEDELLTQLWATPLPHLKWSSASAIDRADPDDPATAAWLRAALKIVERGKAKSLDPVARKPPSLADLVRDGLAELTAVPGPPWEKLRLTPEDLQTIRTEMRSQRDLTVRALGYALDPAQPDAELAAQLVVPMLEQLVGSGELGELCRLLEQLGHTPLGPEGASGLIASRLEEIARKALASLEQGQARPAEATELLRKLGSAALPAIVAALARLPAEARGAALDATADYLDQALVALTDVLATLPAEAALDVVARATGVGGAVAIDLYDAAARHPAPEVAAAGARLAREPTVFSPRRAFAAIAGGDSALRAAALEYACRENTPGAGAAIEALLQDASFKTLPIDDKKALLAALATLDRERGLIAARQLFSQKSLRGGVAFDETRAAAALTLGRLGDADSRRALEQLASRASPVLKDACLEALNRIDEIAGSQMP
ncbi:MAG: hypothetical protein ACOX6T_23425 [Myxococcales bacterium]|jgi:hypothetical protein